MDTRSVVRSRRRSTRLTGQSPQGVSQSNTSKRRHSDHDVSAAASNVTPREGSCPQIGSISETLSRHDAHLATPNTNATTAVTKVEDEGPELPLFPNLRSTKGKPKKVSGADSDVVIASPRKSVEISSGTADQGHVSGKWVKTARGSIRLASDSLVEGTRNNADKKWGVLEEEQNAPSATLTRQRKRLKSMTPDVGKEPVEVEAILSRHTASKTRATATTEGAPDATGSNAEQDSGPDWQDLPARATSEQNPTTRTTHHEELPMYDGKPDRHPQGCDILQDTSPIPELVADIEKIVQDSPMADRNLAHHGTKRTSASTPATALKRRAHANMTTKSRTLRSSSRSVENPVEIEKRPGSEQTDSESSQLDGAFNDSIQGRRKKKAKAAGQTTIASKPKTSQGTKRNVQELSLDGVDSDTPGYRQCRGPDSDGSKPETDRSSANLVETATPRNSPSVGSPTLEIPINTGEAARRSAGPADPVPLTQMAGANQEQEDCDIDSTAAEDGSQGMSRRQSRQGSPEGDIRKCAECGRSPERHIVCAKCQMAIYCGKYCQIWNWPLHTTRCLASDEADHREIELQEAYLGEMWAAALEVLKEEKNAGGTLESVLLGEAVRHSPTQPTFMGQGSPHGFVVFDLGTSNLETRDSESVDRTRAISLRLAQATLGGDE